MSRYADINSGFTLSSHVNNDETKVNPRVKNKFITKDDPEASTHGYWILPENK